MTREVIITVGCPGSGKTTWAREQDPTKWLTMSLDDFRILMFGSKDVYWNKVVPHHGNPVRGFVWQVYARALDTALMHWPGNIILCNTALDEKTSVRDFPILHKHGIVPKLRVWDMPLKELMERNRTRPVEERISDNYLAQCYQTMQAPDAWWRNCGLETEFVDWEFSL